LDRTSLLWIMVVFFGASVVFGMIRNATEDESVVLTIGLEVLALAVIIGAIVLVVRRQR
jgi:hypothetical protein